MPQSKQEKNRDLLVNNLNLLGGASNPLNAEAEHKQDLRAEIERLLNSKTIGNSEALRKLLAYLADKWIADGAQGLKEYTIGVEAFAKAPQYDPQEDPSVRIFASKLRHKLEEYYLKEGSGSLYRIEMPRGHYALSFQAAPNNAATSQLDSLRSEVRKWRLMTAACAVLAALSPLLFLLPWRSAAKQPEAPSIAGQPWTPELDLIWSPFLKSNRSLLISLGTPLFTKFSSGFYRNPKINEEAQANRSEEIGRLQERLGSPYAVPSYAYTGAGEAIGAFLLARLFQGRAPSFTLERSSTITWDDIRHQNVIFVGPPKFNLQLAEIPAEGGICHPRWGDSKSAAAAGGTGGLSQFLGAEQYRTARGLCPHLTPGRLTREWGNHGAWGRLHRSHMGRG